MKKITGDEDFGTPILLLFLFSMLYVSEMGELMKNLESHGSIIITEPILFADNIFKTLGNFCWFLVPTAIVVAAIREKHLFLRFTYFLGSVSLFLTAPVINKLGFKSLYVVKVLLIFVVTMCLLKYLFKTTEMYKRALKQKDEVANHAASDGS